MRYQVVINKVIDTTKSVVVSIKKSQSQAQAEAKILNDQWRARKVAQ